MLIGIFYVQLQKRIEDSLKIEKKSNKKFTYFLVYFKLYLPGLTNGMVFSSIGMWVEKNDGF